MNPYAAKAACTLGLLLGLAGAGQAAAKPSLLPPHQEQGHAPPVAWGPFQLQPRARWHSQSMVVKTTLYRPLNRQARLAPWDVALGWGHWALQEVRQGVVMTQTERWLQFGYASKDIQQRLPAASVLMPQLAQIHVIPATRAVESALRTARPGALVEVEGWLVDAHHPDGWQWLTSLVREDTGEGACELLWVTSWREVSPPEQD